MHWSWSDGHRRHVVQEIRTAPQNGRMVHGKRRCRVLWRDRGIRHWAYREYRAMEGMVKSKLRKVSYSLSQAVFLIFGALTVAWSGAIYFLLPDTQANARFLSQDDRIKAVHRVQENMTGIKNNTWKQSHVYEALLDVKVWLLVAIQIAIQIANGGLQGVSLTDYMLLT